MCIRDSSRTERRAGAGCDGVRAATSRGERGDGGELLLRLVRGAGADVEHRRFARRFERARGDACGCTRGRAGGFWLGRFGQLVQRPEPGARAAAASDGGRPARVVWRACAASGAVAGESIRFRTAPAGFGDASTRCASSPKSSKTCGRSIWAIQFRFSRRLPATERRLVAAKAAARDRLLGRARRLDQRSRFWIFVVERR